MKTTNKIPNMANNNFFKKTEGVLKIGWIVSTHSSCVKGGGTTLR